MSLWFKPIVLIWSQNLQLVKLTENLISLEHLAKANTQPLNINMPASQAEQDFHLNINKIIHNKQE